MTYLGHIRYLEVLSVVDTPETFILCEETLINVMTSANSWLHESSCSVNHIK